MPAPTAERSALEALYASTGGEGWLTKTNWMDESMDVSRWHGVTCRKKWDDGGTVTQLELVDNNLANALPTELAHLSSVEHFELADYSITTPTSLRPSRPSWTS